MKREDNRKKYIKELILFVASNEINNKYNKDFEKNVYPNWNEFDCYTILWWSNKLNYKKKAELTKKMMTFCAPENIWIINALAKYNRRIYYNKYKKNYDFEEIKKVSILNAYNNSLKYCHSKYFQGEILDYLMVNRNFEVKTFRLIGDKLKIKIGKNEYNGLITNHVTNEKSTYYDNFYEIQYKKSDKIIHDVIDPFQ